MTEQVAESQSQNDSNERRVSHIPGIGDFHLPLNRNDLLLLLVAMTQIGLGVETFLAHLISGTIRAGESIPIIAGPIFGILLLIALAMRVMQRRTGFRSSLIVVVTGGMSITVGLLGSAFHWSRAVPPPNFANYGLSLDWIIYAPPVAAPLSFAGVGILAIIALLEDTKPETGRLTLPGFITFNTPMPQTNQFFWLIAFGLYGATLSAFLDHARTDFESFFVWIPVFLGVFGSVATTVMALYHKIYREDYFWFFWTMVLMVAMGILGMGLHINADLPEGAEMGIQIERFIRGAPLMAPMLFAIVGSFGLITMVDAPVTEDEDEETAAE